MKLEQTRPDKPTLVVFDMAGTTVFDDGGVVARCLVSALASGGFSITHPAALALMGIPKPEAIDFLLKPFVVDPEERQTLIPDLHDEFLIQMLRYYREDPAVRSIEGVEETFAKLRAASIKVALDTGFSREIVDVILDRLNWHDKIDASIASDEVAQGRPYPDMIYRLMAQLDITEAITVAKVGDTPVDLQQGEAACCGWVIGVTEGSHTREQLEPYPHTHLIPTVASLPEVLGVR